MREAARHRTRYIAGDRFTTPAWEARFTILTLVADAGESYEDACRFLVEKHAKQDPTSVAWALLFGPQTVLDAAGLIELARQKGEAAKPGSFANNVFVACQRQAKNDEDALKGMGTSMLKLFERAIVLHRLGDEAAARFALEMGERLYASHARNCLASSDLELLGGPGASRDNWWEACKILLWRVRAREAVAGAGAADPWATLFDARSQALVGHAAESQEAFEDAVNLTPGDVRSLDRACGVPRCTGPIHASGGGLRPGSGTRAGERRMVDFARQILPGTGSRCAGGRRLPAQPPSCRMMTWTSSCEPA